MNHKYFTVLVTFSASILLGGCNDAQELPYRHSDAAKQTSQEQRTPFISQDNLDRGDYYVGSNNRNREIDVQEAVKISRIFLSLGDEATPIVTEHSESWIVEHLSSQFKDHDANSGSETYYVVEFGGTLFSGIHAEGQSTMSRRAATVVVRKRGGTVMLAK